MKRCLILATLIAFGAERLSAESPAESQEATLGKLLERVESLEAEVRHLRAEKAEPRVSASKETVSLADSAAEAMSETPARGTFPQIKIRGFGDVDYRWADGGTDRNAFQLGQLDLFLTSQLSENLSVLSENVIESDDDGHFGFEIERLLLQYSPREYFNIAVGRYHTAIGYYNTAFHHGQWLQTAIGRPRVVEFEDEGGLLPIHNVGISASGAIPSGRLGLHYVAEIGNGRNYEPGEESVQNLADNNGFKAVNLALLMRPDWLPGWQTGVSFYYDRLKTSLAPTVSQSIFSAHAVYLSPSFEWLNEGILLRNASDAGTFQTFGFYTQVARRFGPYRPYVRYQYLDGDAADPIVQGIGTPGRQQTLSLGVRYDFTDLAALKLQWDRELGSREHDAARNALTLQVAFTF